MLGKSGVESVGEEWCRAVLGKSGVESVGEEWCRECWGRVV